MTIFLALLYWLIVIVLIIEISTLWVYGQIINKKKLDEFLKRNLDGYMLNEHDKKRNLFYQRDTPYIAKISLGFLSKWYIRDTGTIPRWSKWSKKIDEKRLKLLKNNEERK